MRNYYRLTTPDYQLVQDIRYDSASCEDKDEAFRTGTNSSLFRGILISFSAGLAAAGGLTAQVHDAGREHPNILMIVIDDLNDWVGAMNSHPNSHTPNIDKLASRGVLFTNAHAAAPLCGPTRAAILSGLRPSTTGIYGHNSYSALKSNDKISQVRLLPGYFAQHGYRTFATGKIFHEGSPVEAFDVVGQEQRDFGPRPGERLAYIPPEGLGTSTDWGAYPDRDEDMPDWQNALWTIEQIEKEHEQPFFISVGFVRPHVPWFVPQRWFDLHPVDMVALPHNLEGQMKRLPETSRRFAELPQMPRMEWMMEEMRWERSVQAYLASTSFVDHCVGMVLDALADSPHSQNTVIFLWSDHGYHLGEKGIWAKHTLWERSTRIPLIIARPDDNEPFRVHKPVNHIDFYPTLLELAGIPANYDNEGKSLVPLLDDPEAPGFESSVTTHGYGNHSVRTERWRYIMYEDGTEELYDHMNDPNEWDNLAGMEQYKGTILNLRRYLPDSDAPWDINAAGMNYNSYFRELFEKTRSAR